MIGAFYSHLVGFHLKQDMLNDFFYVIFMYIIDVAVFICVENVFDSVNMCVINKRRRRRKKEKAW